MYYKNLFLLEYWSLSVVESSAGADIFVWLPDQVAPLLVSCVRHPWDEHSGCSHPAPVLGGRGNKYAGIQSLDPGRDEAEHPAFGCWNNDVLYSRCVPGMASF